MIPAEEDFDGTFPFEARYFEGNGFRQHYVDEGPQDTGETFVLLHGEPTWGYLWRNFIPRLAELGRVVVPDHMGFGKSETPQDRAYSAQDHVENLTALLLHLDLSDVTIVGHDWGGLLGSQFAWRNEQRVKRVVLMDSFAKAIMEPEQAPSQPADSTRWMRFIQSDAFDPVMSHLRWSILSVLKTVGLNHTEVATDTWVRAYGSPFPTPEECRGAKQFPRNLLLPETWSYLRAGEATPGALEALQRKPAALLMGEDDDTAPVMGMIMIFKMIWPNAPTNVVSGAHHYLPEDAPETAVSLIEQFVQST